MSQNFGNNYDTANNYWKSIHNAVTKEMITTGKDRPNNNYWVKGKNRTENRGQENAKID